MDIFLKCIDEAFKRTRELLWPIRKIFWLKLLVLYMLTGSCASFPGFNFPAGSPDRKAKIEVNQDDQATVTNNQIGLPDPAPEQLGQVTGEVDERISKLKKFWDEKKKWIIMASVVFLVLMLFLGLLWLWISSRFTMMTYSSLVKGEVWFGRFWRETKEVGNSFFRFKILLVYVPLLIAFVAGFAYYFLMIGSPSELNLKNILIGLAGSFVIILIWIVFYWLLDAFLPIVMYGKNLRATAAIKLICRFLMDNVGKAVVYTLLYIVFCIAFGLALFIGLLIVGLIVGLPTLLIGGGLVALMVKLGWVAKILIGTVLVVLGFAIGILFLFLMVVPLQTFLTTIRMELVAVESKELTNPLR
ncbi:hypothetical protein BVX98_01900 [bacterium F11]|nr:hypothetical protein BVX98_01900 [bacterium F11]